jgi:hypothetical protein
MRLPIRKKKDKKIESERERKRESEKEKINVKKYVQIKINKKRASMTSSKQNTTTLRAQAPFMPLSCNSVLKDTGFNEVVANILLM